MKIVRPGKMGAKNSNYAKGGEQASYIPAYKFDYERKDYASKVEREQENENNQ